MSSVRALAYSLALLLLMGVALLLYRYSQQAGYVAVLEQGISDVAAQHNALLARQAQDRVQVQDYLNQIDRLQIQSTRLQGQLNETSGCAIRAIESDVASRVQQHRDQNRERTRTDTVGVPSTDSTSRD